MRILFAAGGTAGHINPAIAVAQYLRETEKADCLFVAVPGGMEERLVAEAGFSTVPLRIQGLKRRLSLDNLRRICAIPGAIRRAKQILRDFVPDAVFATGGYLSFPVVWAASGRHIPCYLHESNAVAGFSIRLLSKRANAVLLNYLTAASTLSKKCCIHHVGNPLRSAFRTQGRAQARRCLGIRDNTCVILSFGGSLGASKLNEVCLSTAEHLLPVFPNLAWHHVTGRDKYDDIAGAHSTTPVSLHPYLDNIATYMAAADVVISRAGAVTLTELSALGKTAVLIPYPNAAGNHQVKNARVYQKAESAIVIEEHELTEEGLKETILDLLKHPQKRKKYEERIKHLYVPDSVKNIAKILKKSL